MLQFYPFPEHRPGTRETLTQVRNAIDSGKKFIIIKAPTGCHAYGQKVLRADGTEIAVQNVKVGDRLLGPDGKARTVLDLHRGRDSMYKIEPHVRGARGFVVNKGHILSLKDCDDKITNISVEAYIKNNISHKKLYRSTIDYFPDAYNEALPIDPYILGLILSKVIIIRKNKIDIVLPEFRDIFEYIMKKEHSKYFEDPISFLNSALTQIGFRDNTKIGSSIPDIYKFSNKENRMKLIAALTDANARIDSDGIIFFSNTLLFEDIRFICNSIGFRVHDIPLFKIKIYGNISKLPLKIKRNLLSDKHNRSVNQSYFGVVGLGIQDYYGFEVDGDNLYLLDDFTVTHNSGKSGLAVAIARAEKAVVLTPTKILQDQYESTEVFNTEYTIKGKSNYKCGLKNYKNITVDRAICCSNVTASDNAYMTPWESNLKDSKNPAMTLKGCCVSAGICEYYKLLAGIPTRPGAIMNYDLAFLVKKRPGSKEGIDLGQTIVLDEAHQLIDKIKSIFGFSLSEKSVSKILGATAKRRPTESPLDWITRLYALAQVKAAEETDLKNASEISQLVAKLEGTLALEITNEYKFHIEDSKDRIEIKPLNMRYLKGLVFYPFKHVVMMSATIPPNFCDLLGLKPEETEIIEIASTFNKKNRPVVFLNDLEILNYKTKLNKQHPTFKAVQTILDKHKGEKGIIHCSNYRIFEELKKAYSKNSRFIWVERGMDKTAVLDRHSKTDKDTVLVSPSMIEGVDLKDNLARFQILLKLPYAILDDYTKKMMKIYDGYYEADVIMNIMQAYGRAIRTESDHAIFYILDGAFSRFIKNKHQLPKYLAEALQSCKVSEL